MNEETTVFRGSPSLITRFSPLFLGFLVLAGALTGFVLLSAKPGDNPSPFRWVLAGVAALSFVYMLVVVLLVKSTVYEVTSERIRIRQGILTKRTEELELYRANDTSLIEPLTLRMLGLGTIEVRTIEASTPSIYLEAVHGARALRENLRKHIEECRDRKRVRVTELDEPGPESQKA